MDTVAEVSRFRPGDMVKLSDLATPLPIVVWRDGAYTPQGFLSDPGHIHQLRNPDGLSVVAVSTDGAGVMVLQVRGTYDLQRLRFPAACFQKLAR